MQGYHQYKSTIDALLRCAAICNHCASSSTKEEDVKMMASCIQLDMECAAMCMATAQLLSMGTSQAKEVSLLCSWFCDTCATECAKHTRNEHCKECADVCRNTANQCRNIQVTGVRVND
jgi:hypothetical protein